MHLLFLPESTEEVIARLGRTLAEADGKDETAARELLEHDPTHFYALRALAKELDEAGKKSEAAELARRGIESHPYSPAFYFLAADAAGYAAGDAPLAIGLSKLAVQKARAAAE